LINSQENEETKTYEIMRRKVQEKIARLELPIHQTNRPIIEQDTALF
jgi:hypothetical protein